MSFHSRYELPKWLVDAQPLPPKCANLKKTKPGLVNPPSRFRDQWRLELESTEDLETENVKNGYPLSPVNVVEFVSTTTNEDKSDLLNVPLAGDKLGARRTGQMYSR